MLSYSTGDSGTGADVDKVRAGTAFVRERRPDLLVEGPIQYDAAADPTVAQHEDARTRRSPAARRSSSSRTSTPATTPTRPCSARAGAVAIGPVLQGLRKPINDLSRGALSSDIVNTVAITAIQAGTASDAADRATRAVPPGRSRKRAIP